MFFPACLSGHWSRCGYCAISTIGLRSIASPPLLPPHHSVTPCHSPGSAKSNDEFFVPRLPLGILGYCDSVTQPIQASGRNKPLTCRQSSSQVLCYMLVCVRAFLCVFVIMSYMKHEWQRWPMSQGRPSHSSTFEITHKHTLQMCTLSNTLAYGSTSRKRMFMHSPSFIPSNLTTAHAVSDSIWNSLLFRAKYVCVTLLNLSFGSCSCIA